MQPPKWWMVSLHFILHCDPLQSLLPLLWSPEAVQLRLQRLHGIKQRDGIHPLLFLTGCSSARQHLRGFNVLLNHPVDEGVDFANRLIEHADSLLFDDTQFLPDSLNILTLEPNDLQKVTLKVSEL